MELIQKCNFLTTKTVFFLGKADCLLSRHDKAFVKHASNACGPCRKYIWFVLYHRPIFCIMRAWVSCDFMLFLHWRPNCLTLKSKYPVTSRLLRTLRLWWYAALQNVLTADTSQLSRGMLASTTVLVPKDSWGMKFVDFGLQKMWHLSWMLWLQTAKCWRNWHSLLYWHKMISGGGVNIFIRATGPMSGEAATYMVLWRVCMENWSQASRHSSS